MPIKTIKTIKIKGKGRPSGNSLQSRYDPFGGYTGKPLDPKDKPVQDADDI